MSVRPLSLLLSSSCRLSLAARPFLTSIPRRSISLSSTSRFPSPSSSSFKNAAQDPYTSQASESPSVKEKVQELLSALKSVQTSMLTTRAPDSDELHSRAMHAASTEGLQFTFFANKESGKMDGIEKDSHVNISYCQDGGTWVSVAGTAEVSNDREKIARLYNPMLKAWFGDNEKPNQRGDENDERIELIEVRPIEIRFFVQKRTTVGKVVDIVSSTVTGNVATPGGLFVLSGEDLKEAQRVALSLSSSK